MMSIPHNEKCVKYKKQIENLKLDLVDLQEECDSRIKLTYNEKTTTLFMGLLYSF